MTARAEARSAAADALAATPDTRLTLTYLEAHPEAADALRTWLGPDDKLRELMVDAIQGAASIGLHFPALNFALDIEDTIAATIEAYRRFPLPSFAPDTGPDDGALRAALEQVARQAHSLAYADTPHVYRDEWDDKTPRYRHHPFESCPAPECIEARHALSPTVDTEPER